jgi:hypothetical protein
MVCILRQSKNDTGSHSAVFLQSPTIVMPLHRNFIYWIDKRRWKYHFLLMSLCEARKAMRT